MRRADGALVGKVESGCTCTASQHGGHDTTLVSFHFTLLHHGVIVSRPLHRAAAEEHG